MQPSRRKKNWGQGALKDSVTLRSPPAQEEDRLFPSSPHQRKPGNIRGVTTLAWGPRQEVRAAFSKASSKRLVRETSAGDLNLKRNWKTRDSKHTLIRSLHSSIAR